MSTKKFVKKARHLAEQQVDAVTFYVFAVLMFLG